MKDKLQELDKVLGYMLDQLETHDLFDRLNLIITSVRIFSFKKFCF